MAALARPVRIVWRFLRTESTDLSIRSSASISISSADSKAIWRVVLVVLVVGACLEIDGMDSPKVSGVLVVVKAVLMVDEARKTVADITFMMMDGIGGGYGG